MSIHRANRTDNVPKSLQIAQPTLLPRLNPVVIPRFTQAAELTSGGAETTYQCGFLLGCAGGQAAPPSAVRFPSRLCRATSGSTVSSASARPQSAFARGADKCRRRHARLRVVTDLRTTVLGFHRAGQPKTFVPWNKSWISFLYWNIHIIIITTKYIFLIFTFKMWKNTITATFFFLNIWKHHYLSWLSSHWWMWINFWMWCK